MKIKSLFFDNSRNPKWYAKEVEVDEKGNVLMTDNKNDSAIPASTVPANTNPSREMAPVVPQVSPIANANPALLPQGEVKKSHAVENDKPLSIEEARRQNEKRQVEDNKASKADHKK